MHRRRIKQRKMSSLRCKEILCLLYSSVLFLSGLFLIGFSIVLSYKLFYHFKFLPSDTVGPFAVLTLIGFVHLFLTWLGVKGPTKEHDFHIILFIVITALLFFMEFCSGVWALVLWFNVEAKIIHIMQESLNDYLNYDYDKKEWMLLESKLHCCGFNGLGDYASKGTLPLSCCQYSIPTNVNCSKIYEDGCKEPLVARVEFLMMQIALTGFFSGLFQIIGIILFYTFYKNLKTERIKRTNLRRSRMNSLTRHGSTPISSPATIT